MSLGIQITDPGKKSKKGKLTLEKTETGFTTVTEGKGDPAKDCLVEVSPGGSDRHETVSFHHASGNALPDIYANGFEEKVHGCRRKGCPTSSRNFGRQPMALHNGWRQGGNQPKRRTKTSMTDLAGLKQEREKPNNKPTQGRPPWITPTRVCCMATQTGLPWVVPPA